MNTGIAFVLMFWIIAPILYCAYCAMLTYSDTDDTFISVTNSNNFAYFPISSTFAFDNTGQPYQSSTIVTDGIFDHAKYVAYSPVFLSATQALGYGIAFASFPAVLVHTFRELYT